MSLKIKKPLNAIERIEIIKGALSTLYGSDAMGGVINIITKKHINKYGLNLNIETIQNEHRYFGGHYVANMFGIIPIIKDVLGIQLRSRFYYHSPSSIMLSGPIQAQPDGGIGNTTEGLIFDIDGRILWNLDSQNHICFDTQFTK